MNIITFVLIKFIRIYKYLFSPLTGHSCRYLPTCSEYFVDALKTHGLFKGCWIGIRRIFSCHPIKLLGGGSGIDFVTKKDNRKNTNG